jgi:hypothetical protein
MIKAIALIGLAVALTAPHAALAEAPSAPSGYGTEGPNGQRLDAWAQSTYARQWNQANESLWRAESSAEWLRLHGKSSPLLF